MTERNIQALEQRQPGVSLESSVCPAAAIGGACVLAEFSSHCLYPEVNFPIETFFLNQINKEMGGIFSFALCPWRYLTLIGSFLS